jgi:hypothetical protein
MVHKTAREPMSREDREMLNYRRRIERDMKRTEREWKKTAEGYEQTAK